MSTALEHPGEVHAAAWRQAAEPHSTDVVRLQHANENIASINATHVRWYSYVPEGDADARSVQETRADLFALFPPHDKPGPAQVNSRSYIVVTFHRDRPSCVAHSSS